MYGQHPLNGYLCHSIQMGELSHTPPPAFYKPNSHTLLHLPFTSPTLTHSSTCLLQAQLSHTPPPAFYMPNSHTLLHLPFTSPTLTHSSTCLLQAHPGINFIVYKPTQASISSFTSQPSHQFNCLHAHLGIHLIVYKPT